MTCYVKNITMLETENHKENVENINNMTSLKVCYVLVIYFFIVKVNL